jgi:ElaB/YqjD/DUF883 family membrane-anchored ribosome-binding protein
MSKTSTAASDNDENVKTLIDDTKQRLGNNMDTTGASVSAVYEHFADNFSNASNKLASTRKDLKKSANAALTASDKYVHDHPWGTLCIAVGLGFVAGIFMASR